MDSLLRCWNFWKVKIPKKIVYEVNIFCFCKKICIGDFDFSEIFVPKFFLKGVSCLKSLFYKRKKRRESTKQNMRRATVITSVEVFFLKGFWLKVVRCCWVFGSWVVGEDF